ncbi:hypothetical protein BH10ACI1_BH10ACI1_25340 [soil metagenome]
MAYKKKNIPKDVQKAQQRTDGMKSIEPALDLGNGVSVATMEAAITKVSNGISAYNTLLSQLDQMGNDIEADIKSMNELSSRALKGAEFVFGADSNEYEMLGGTRTSERKKYKKKDGEGIVK